MKNKKTLLIILGALLFIGGLVYLYGGHLLNRNSQTTVPLPTDSNHVTNKDQSLTDGTPPATDKVITPSTPSDSNPPEQTPEKPVITRAEASGDFLRISAILNQPSTGTCLLTLEKSGLSPVTKTAPIIVGPSYYTCNGFRIPLTDLPSGGEWSVIVTHQHEGKSTPSDTKTINVQD